MIMLIIFILLVLICYINPKRFVDLYNKKKKNLCECHYGDTCIMGNKIVCANCEKELK